MMRAPYWPFPYTREKKFRSVRRRTSYIVLSANIVYIYIIYYILYIIYYILYIIYYILYIINIMIYECTPLYSYAAMMDMSTSMLNFVAKYALTGDQTIPRSLVAREASLRSCTVLGPSLVDRKLSEHIFVSPFRFPDDGGQFFANRKTSSIESYTRVSSRMFLPFMFH